MPQHAGTYADYAYHILIDQHHLPEQLVFFLRSLFHAGNAQGIENGIVENGQQLLEPHGDGAVIGHVAHRQGVDGGNQNIVGVIDDDPAHLHGEQGLDIGNQRLARFPVNPGMAVFFQIGIHPTANNIERQILHHRGRHQHQGKGDIAPGYRQSHTLHGHARQVHHQVDHGDNPVFLVGVDKHLPVGAEIGAGRVGQPQQEDHVDLPHGHRGGDEQVQEGQAARTQPNNRQSDGRIQPTEGIDNLGNFLPVTFRHRLIEHIEHGTANAHLREGQNGQQAPRYLLHAQVFNAQVAQEQLSGEQVQHQHHNIIGNSDYRVAQGVFGF